MAVLSGLEACPTNRRAPASQAGGAPVRNRFAASAIWQAHSKGHTRCIYHLNVRRGDSAPWAAGCRVARPQQCEAAASAGGDIPTGRPYRGRRGSMANSKYEYVKQYELDDRLLPGCWIVVRVDGKGFTK